MFGTETERMQTMWELSINYMEPLQTFVWKQILYALLLQICEYCKKTFHQFKWGAEPLHRWRKNRSDEADSFNKWLHCRTCLFFSVISVQCRRSIVVMLPCQKIQKKKHWWTMKTQRCVYIEKVKKLGTYASCFHLIPATHLRIPSCPPSLTFSHSFFLSSSSPIVSLKLSVSPSHASLCVLFLAECCLVQPSVSYFSLFLSPSLPSLSPVFPAKATHRMSFLAFFSVSPFKILETLWSRMALSRWVRGDSCVCCWCGEKGENIIFWIKWKRPAVVKVQYIVLSFVFEPWRWGVYSCVSVWD